MGRTRSWVCEYCGDQGRTSEPIDMVQCPSCGEPVVPTTEPEEDV